jgi:putative ABC transport system ATP-binding protein
MTTVIETHNLTKTYKMAGEKTVALDHVSLTVEKGEYIAIIGPSGSGKSTLLNLLGCLDHPTSGTYLLDGQDVSRLSAKKLASIRSKRIGFVFQSFNLLPRMTVLENVMMPLAYSHCPRRQRRARAIEMLQRAGLEASRYKHKGNQLSGGQSQRVAIARALVNQPSLILADEPTGNLDSATGRMVLATFEDLNAQGHTIVLITHDSDVAARAKRVVRIQDGKLFAISSGSTLHEITKAVDEQ